MKEKARGKKDNRTICATDREHFRALLENHPLPAFVVDISSIDPRQYTFLAANEAAQLLYGYTEDEFLEMTLTQLRPQEDLERYTTELRKAGTEAPSFQTTSPHRHVTRDGSIIHVDVSGNHFVALNCTVALLLSRLIIQAVLMRDRYP